ncbi:MAG: hypothetical protein ACJAVV_000702 [Alphaproteobacteria bacterium]|jgi:hypothetical protein
MEEWTGFELSEQVLEEATQWIAVLDDIQSSVALCEHDFADSAEHKNVEEHYLNTNLQHVQQSQQAQYALVAEFNEWLNAHVQHQQAYAEMSLLWAKSVCIHEISDRISASNVFAFTHSKNKPHDENDFAFLANECKRKQLPILLPHNQDSQAILGRSRASSPDWAYVVSMGLIVVGLTSPFIQQLF